MSPLTDRMYGSAPRWKIAAALLAVYLIWGSTYFATKLTLESFPPLLAAGLRFIFGGLALYIPLRMRGVAAPTAVQWKTCVLIGVLLMGGGTGGVVFAQQWVASGLAALMIAMVTFWATLFAAMRGLKPSRGEVVGIAFGMLGVVLLNLDKEMSAHPIGAAVLVLASISWAFGSVWSRGKPVPAGFMAIAAQMLAGGALLSVLSILSDEHVGGVPSWRSVWALAYLTIFGSLIGYSSYMFLLTHVRPALATSYGFVNPVIALWLGWKLGAEPMTPRILIASAIIITAVAAITLHRARAASRVRRPADEAVEATIPAPTPAAGTGECVQEECAPGDDGGPDVAARERDGAPLRRAAAELAS